MFFAATVWAGCPFLESKNGKNGKGKGTEARNWIHDDDAYVAAFKELSLEDVQADIIKLMHSSDPSWPSDNGNYGPLFVRLAWHTSGSYRSSDGRGGCDGGRQRFLPELAWDDNTNLDKARSLLWPIKQKYGLGLSWGDLFILAGTTAVQDMGGPILGFCGGRRDDADGAASTPLGPTSVQEKVAPCETNGECTEPLGSTTIGLIYVNPEGPMGEPDPSRSAPEVRDTFARMAMNDSETVALIGGGHAFGKTHGACPLGAGPNPEEDPSNPWPGLCGTGNGNDTFTSGFEGYWTTSPDSWSNEYFINLIQYEWTSAKGPGGHYQWSPSAKDGGPTPPADAALMMLTSDISLTNDEEYLRLVQTYAKDPAELNKQFAAAWYKLTTRDMGPVTRCMGDMVPPAQPFQFPLPAPLPPSELADFDEVKKSVQKVIRTPKPSIIFADHGSYGPLFLRLAWQCANTFRQTDYMGGCNGARLRLEPQISWPQNAALDKALELLSPIKESFGAGLSWADLIVLAGTTALEDAAAESGGIDIPFKGGRTDVPPKEESSETPSYLTFRLDGGSTSDTVATVYDAGYILGLTSREFVVLVGGGHSLGGLHKDRSGFVDGAFTSKPLQLDNEYFKNLLNLDWEKLSASDSEHEQYAAVTPAGAKVTMLKTDMTFKWNGSYRAIVEELAAMPTCEFLQEFSQVFLKVVNADLF